MGAKINKMKKAISILQALKPTEKYYKLKVKILSQLINEPEHGHILPRELFKWAEKNKLKIKNHDTDKCIWDTVSLR